MLNRDTPPRYHIYLLRFWEERGQHPDSAVVWRFCLEDPSTGKRHGFAHLDALTTFLEAELADAGVETPPRDLHE